MIDPSKLEPIFIGGHRKSGTTLLIALLDGHPEVCVYPDDSKFFHLFYPEVFLSKHSLESKLDRLVDQNFGYLKNLIFEKCGAKQDYFDFDQMVRIFRELPFDESDWGSFLENMVCAFSESSPQSNERFRFWAQKTTSLEIFAPLIFQRYPKAKLVQVIRDPRDNYASLKIGFDRKYKNFKDTNHIEKLLQSCIDRCSLGYQMGMMIRNTPWKAQQAFVRYEDLVSNPEGTLSKLGAFLEIDSSAFNQKPTACMLPWKGNNMGGLRFEGVSAQPIGNWMETLTEHEVAVLEFYFRDYMEKFEYSVSTRPETQMTAVQKHYEWFNFCQKEDE